MAIKVHPTVSQNPSTTIVTKSMHSLHHRMSTRASLCASGFFVYAKPKLFVVLWWCVCLVHGCEIAFLVSMTWLYHWLLTNELGRYNFLDVLNIGMSYSILNLMNWVFAVVASLHGSFLLRVLVRSFKVQTFVFTATKTSSKTKVFSSKHTQWVSCRGSFVKHYIQPVFFIDGEYFDDYFLVQECLEVAAQIYQAHRMSFLIPTRWINHIVCGMIFLNCASTPLLHQLIAKDKLALRRLLDLTTSAFLNFINSVIIPIVIFSKYVRLYDPTTTYFPLRLVFNDSWYDQALRENQQVLLTSPMVFLSTLWPHCSLLNCLVICQSMLRRETLTFTSTESAKMQVVGKAPTTSHLFVTRRKAYDSIKANSGTAAKASWASRLRKTWRFLVTNLLWLAGIVVLGIHIDAQRGQQLVGCQLMARPWLSSSKSSCVVMNINCRRREINGNATQIDGVLSQLNPDTMVTLVFSHCPQLEIPPSIRSFYCLDGIDIYNSTLTRWDAQSSVRDQDFPCLSFVYFTRSNVSEVPAGLLADPLPKTMLEVYFYATNLSSLPQEIKKAWSTLDTILLEFSAFDHVPNVVQELPNLGMLSMTGTSVSHVDDVDLFANDALYTVYLSGLPSLTSLPNTTLGDLDGLGDLELEFTGIDEVPEYIQQWYLDSTATGKSIAHSLFGSPFCEKTRFQTTQEALYHQQVCAKDQGFADGYFPIEWVEPQRLW